MWPADMRMPSSSARPHGFTCHRVATGGLPHVAIPRITLESGRSWPASGLAGAQRRPE